MGKKMALCEADILITGESGTGKEMFAQAIHNASSRAELPFVAVNCSTLNSALLESELFGYEDGAFTGARKGGKIGLFSSPTAGPSCWMKSRSCPTTCRPNCCAYCRSAP